MRTVLLRVRPECPMAMIYDLRITSSRFLAGDPEKEKEGKKCLEAAQIQRPCGLRQLYITISKLVCFQRSRSIVVLLHPEKIVTSGSCILRIKGRQSIVEERSAAVRDTNTAPRHTLRYEVWDPRQQSLLQLFSSLICVATTL